MTTIAIGIVVLILLIFVLWRNTKRPVGAPPGPPMWPLLGNIPLFVGSSDRMLITLKKLTHKYGDIFSFKLGNNYFVFLNGYDCLKEALVANAMLFSDRPNISIRECSGHQYGIAGISGERWKKQKKFIVKTLREFGFGTKIMEQKIVEEVSIFTNNLKEQNGAVIDLGNCIKKSISNIVCSIMFGDRFDYDDPEFKELLSLMDIIFESKVMFQNLYPVLRYIPWDFTGLKRMRFAWETLGDHIQTRLNERRKKPNKDVARDFIDAFLLQIEKDKSDQTKIESFSDLDVVWNIMDIFLAGTETTSSTIGWALLYLIRNADIQDAIKAEIDKVVGLSRRPSLEDRVKLPYTMATISEIFRVADVLPFGIAHTVSEDTIFRGYKLPKSCIVIANISSVLDEPGIWESPAAFKPHRFLNEKGYHQEAEQLIPFSLGRRSCIGESMARSEVFLYLTSMIQQFRFLSPSDEPPTLNRLYGITNKPQPFSVKVIQRE